MRWNMASAVDAPGGRLENQSHEPMQVVRTIPLQSVSEPRPGTYVVDFGTILAGWVKLRARGPAGATVTLRFAEMLGEDGLLNQLNLRTAEACDRYTFKGSSDLEQYEPRFTYHGFRYVQIEGLAERPTSQTLEARMVRSAVAQRGQFECSHELYNSIHRMVVQTEASNLHGIPTDCPQRDERMGWLNDMTARAEQAVYNFDLVRFYSKFVDDIADSQDPRTGEIPDTVPFRWGYRHADPVSMSFLLLPWLLYQHYGETRLMQRHYSGMVKWVERLLQQAPDGILAFSRWGDWSEPSGKQDETVSPVSRRTPGALVSTAFLAEHCRLLGQIAHVIGREEDSRLHQENARRVTESFDGTFWDDAKGVYATGSQACSALALAFGLVPEDRITRVVNHLVGDIAANDYHLTTGNIATKYLLEVLSARGLHEVACAIVAQKSYPSWGFMLQHGATTLWERWEHATGTGMNSHCHPMLGSIGSWFYRHVAGLQLAPDAVGCDRLIYRPRPNRHVTSARATLPTPLGTALLGWHKTGEQIMIEAEVPCGATAELELLMAGEGLVISESGQVVTPARLPAGVKDIRPSPGMTRITLGSGVYRLVAHERAAQPALSQT